MGSTLLRRAIVSKHRQYCIDGILFREVGGMSGYSQALHTPFHNWPSTRPTTWPVLTDGILCAGGQFAGASGHKYILSVSDCAICAVRNAISYCTAVSKQPDTSHSHVDDLPMPEQDALHIQVALHVLHALATFMGNIVKVSSL